MKTASALFLVALFASLAWATKREEVFVYESIWQSQDRDIIHSYVFEEEQFVGVGVPVPDKSPADYNDLWNRNPLGVIKTVYFYERNAAGMRLGVRRVVVGSRRVAHIDARNKVISNVLCDTSLLAGVVEWGMDKGEAACSSYLPSPSLQASGFYNNALYIDSLVTSQSWKATADSADINTWPLGR